jgi:hypothetical protein
MSATEDQGSINEPLYEFDGVEIEPLTDEDRRLRRFLAVAIFRPVMINVTITVSKDDHS